VREAPTASSSSDSVDTVDEVLSIPSDYSSTASVAHLPTVSSSDILAPVKADMEDLSASIRGMVGGRSARLVEAAEQILGAGGKKLRPAIVFLVAHATSALTGRRELTAQHRRLAAIIEMIHTASLLHDDVLDECDVRRGQSTVNNVFGNKIAVLSGDYFFAQSSWQLANLDNLEVIKLIAKVIADFADGEISQKDLLFDTNITHEQYLDKSFYKTASLIAASCKSAAVFSGCEDSVKNAMFEYGRHLGLAFQIIDDILDITQTKQQLGKPQGQDLASGNLTSPVLFALQCPQHGAELRELIETEYQAPGGLPRALDLVKLSGGVAQAQTLARQEADKALQALSCLESVESDAKHSLELMIGYVLDRLY
jgi:all-trans-nonaprenyl-diphosphate synthase